MSETYYGYRFLLLALILSTNAFFAAAEVALVSVRLSRLRELAEEGRGGAQAALRLLANRPRLLSVTQVGVTLASLGLGWAGEDTLYSLFMTLFGPIVPASADRLLHGASFALGFMLMTLFHVVLGEVVPKNLAIVKADSLAMLVAPALLAFARVSSPFIYVIERAASGLSRMIGLRSDLRGGGHSAEELKLIVSSARREGGLRKYEEDVMRRVLDLEDLSAREIMVPRNNVVAVSIDAKPDQILRTMRESQYSRLPVYEGKPEQIIGILHYKDVLRFREEYGSFELARPGALKFRLRSLLRKPPVVPETKLVGEMVEEFRRSRVHMAMVVDEFGTIVGLVTFEDVLEQVFGEIEDEQDLARQPPTAEARTLIVEGTINIRDLETQHGIELPVDAGFETLAGFLLSRLGYIPQPGEQVREGDRLFTVLEMDHNRIARVRIEKAPGSPPSQALA